MRVGSLLACYLGHASVIYLLLGSQVVCRRRRARHERAPALSSYTTSKTIPVTCIKEPLLPTSSVAKECCFCLGDVVDLFGPSPLWLGEGDRDCSASVTFVADES